MERKYEFTGESKCFAGKTLYRIRAVKDFGDIEKGDLGGWIETEGNLAHNGSCWVEGNAIVRDNAKVEDKAIVWGHAIVRDYAEVRDNAVVMDYAVVRDYAVVKDNAVVMDNAVVEDNAVVWDSAIVGDNAVVKDNVIVKDNAIVRDNAVVRGHAVVIGYACIGKNALIQHTNDYFTINNIGSRGNTTTFYRTRDNDIGVSCGYFTGTLDEFLIKVKEIHGENKYGKEYRAAAELAKCKIILD